MSINFTANFIKRTQIPKMCNDGCYSLQDVSVVEFDKNDKNDVNTLRQISHDWCETFSSEIYNEVVKGYKYDDVEQEHYFGLTTQMSNFDIVDSDEVLGVMLFSKTTNPEDQINWLQVRSDSKYGANYRDFKGVGSTLVNMLKKLNYNKTIKVDSAENAVEFYKNLGFKNRVNESSFSLYLDV